jgi:hypothetical protein
MLLSLPRLLKGRRSTFGGDEALPDVATEGECGWGSSSISGSGSDVGASLKDGLFKVALSCCN